MIDFRYHLVSLIAVFLAVALGIVIGTTQLNGPVLTNLQSQVTALQEDKRLLEDETRQLQTTLDQVGSFEEAVGPALVADTLAGRSVLLVVGSEDVPAETVEGITALLADAGATVTGALRLPEGFGDPANESGLRSYLTGPGLPPGVTPAETDDTGELLADVLADVLVVPGADSEEAGVVPDAAATASVLAGLEELEVLSRDTASVAPADFAVLLTAGTASGDDAEERTTALVQLATALDARGSGAVIAGDLASVEDGGLVGAVRADRPVSDGLSTIDNADTPAGQISTVLALVAEATDTSGQYGVGEGTQPVPTPVP
ncbi:copper transporter [Modestobacter sp. VKM Ac-2979]|uniref:copper transporter n=1 Tax=unclassified Modestobacter TaxID=2643866 RepID=UPI0022ABA3B5|nr:MULTISPECIES: copper transporter [unclassified Modestobacter]MCZ2812152.1 copper transporter [Modestobacter sp. VKM Ac-2979]MCZ2843876.1 copper transporter [Modestobacter sp. VKM Ac-2980]